MLIPDATRAWPIVRFDEIDSTNEEARRRAAAGDPGPAWLVANRQSAGRGRLGRAWDSASGNLFATAHFSFVGSPMEAALICFSAGLAVIDAAAASGVWTEPLGLKWPNDVLLGRAKLAGILIETGHSEGASASGALAIAAGFGVNITHAPKVPDRPTACLAELPGAAGLDAQAYLPRLDIAFRARLSRLGSEGFEATRADWLQRASFLGARVELSAQSGRISGLMRDLGPDGALVVELDDGGLHHVRAGEISILG